MAKLAVSSEANSTGVATGRPLTRSTLLLARGDIRALMTPRDYFDAVTQAFRAGKEGRAVSPPPLHIQAEGGGFHAKGAWLGGRRPFVAVKVNGNFPGNPERCGLPTIQGAILLCDAVDGSVLAILDSIEVTIMRTAAASALAAHHLARKDASVLGVCGCGGQARAQAAALADVVEFRHGYAADIAPGKAARFAAEMSQALGFPIEAVADARQAARKSDVIVTCTTARAPILGDTDVAPGAFIAAVGADNHDKSEIAPALMARAKVVVDALEQCLAIGDLHQAVKAGAMTAAGVYADLGDIVIGAKPGRTRDDEVIVFDSTGTALQDAASAALIYERASAAGKGMPFVLAGP